MNLPLGFFCLFFSSRAKFSLKATLIISLIFWLFGSVQKPVLAGCTFSSNLIYLIPDDCSPGSCPQVGCELKYHGPPGFSDWFYVGSEWCEYQDKANNTYPGCYQSVYSCQDPCAPDACGGCPACTCGDWVTQGCNQYPCSSGEGYPSYGYRRYTRTCTPSNCSNEVECRDECAPAPTATPTPTTPPPTPTPTTPPPTPTATPTTCPCRSLGGYCSAICPCCAPYICDFVVPVGFLCQCPPCTGKSDCTSPPSGCSGGTDCNLGNGTCYTVTPTPTPTTPGPTATATPTVPSPTATPTPTTPVPTPTATPTGVLTPTPTGTVVPTPTATPTVPGPTATPTSVSTPTPTTVVPTPTTNPCPSVCSGSGECSASCPDCFITTGCVTGTSCGAWTCQPNATCCPEGNYCVAGDCMYMQPYCTNPFSNCETPCSSPADCGLTPTPTPTPATCVSPNQCRPTAECPSQPRLNCSANQRCCPPSGTPTPTPRATSTPTPTPRPTATPTITPTPTPATVTLSGYVFLDPNESGRKEGIETCFEGEVTIWLDSDCQFGCQGRPSFTSTAACNTYSFVMTRGTHTISIAPVPTGTTPTGWSGTNALGAEIFGSGSQAIVSF